MPRWCTHIAPAQPGTCARPCKGFDRHRDTQTRSLARRTERGAGGRAERREHAPRGLVHQPAGRLRHVRRLGLVMLRMCGAAQQQGQEENEDEERGCGLED